jgi:hypothetical protein
MPVSPVRRCAPSASQHPDHQAEAYRLGVEYGQCYSPVDLDVEVAYLDRKIPSADRLTAPFLTGIRDALAAGGAR